LAIKSVRKAFFLRASEISRRLILGASIAALGIGYYRILEEPHLLARWLEIVRSIPDTRKGIKELLNSNDSHTGGGLSEPFMRSIPPHDSVNLWRTREAYPDFAKMLKRVYVDDTGQAVDILRAAPSPSALSEILSVSGIPITTLKPSHRRGANPPRLSSEEVDSFFVLCSDTFRKLPPAVVVFFMTTNAELLIASSHTRELKALINHFVRTSEDDTTELIPGLLGAFFSQLSPGIIPLLVSQLTNTTAVELVPIIRRLLKRAQTIPDGVQLAQEVYDKSLSAGLGRALFLELVLDLLLCSPSNSRIPEDWERQLLSAFFKSTQSWEKVLLTKILGTRPSAGLTLIETVSGLERQIGVSDFEISERRKAAEKQLSRPLVDTELFAFHEELEESEAPELALDNASLLVRIAIVSDIIRHKLSNNEPGAPGVDLKYSAALLLRCTFKQLAGLLETTTDPKLVRQLVRGMANISTLGRLVSVDVRDAFLRDAKKIISSLNPETWEVHGKAEFDRLTHNIRCLPIRTAPMLIDSFLPLSSHTPADSEVDFVFIHGLRGGLKTWRVFQPDKKKSEIKLWPSMCLKDQYPTVRLLAFTYEAPLWYATHKQHYSEIDVKKNFDEMALSLRSALADAGVGRNGKKVVFVTFSMGGLVAKRALVDDPLLRENTLGIVFFATPHLGSPIADYAYYASGVGGLLVSPFVADLSRKSKQVLSLHESFMSTCKGIPTLSVCETAQSEIGAGIKAMIVPYESCSACREDGKAMLAGENVDHESVSKISAQLLCNDPRVSALLDFLNSIIASAA
jgi:hypothetical protein